MPKLSRPAGLHPGQRSAGAIRLRVLIWAAATFFFVAAAILLVLLLSRPEVRIDRKRDEPGDDEAQERAAAGEVPRPEKKVFESPLAGQWYPDGPEPLRAALRGYLDSVEESQDPTDNIMALILPHAGYRYSGAVAAAGVRLVRGGGYGRVVILGPTHSVSMPNMASVPDATHYATPLGEVVLDTAFIEALKAHDLFETVPAAHAREHSTQIEVPWIQYALPDVPIVPVVVGQLDRETACGMAAVLGELVDDRTLVVVSSDFTHYGPRFGYVPFDEDVPGRLKELDMASAALIEDKEFEGFLHHVEETGTTICGACPIALLLAMLPPEAEAHTLAYDTSGNMLGGYENSVSYLTIAFTGNWAKGGGAVMTTPDAGNHPKDPLSQDDKQRLLELARATVPFYLEHRREPRPEELGIEVTPAMRETMGAFVSIYKDGDLRGCIGEIIPRRPVCEAVAAQAVNAAFEDPRFPPVAPVEVPDLRFEVTVYASAPWPVGSPADIELGRHGIVIEKHGRRALFLPQVAPEYGWTLEETLQHLCRKAGLPLDAWKDDMSFSVFEGVIFGDPDKRA